MEFGTTWDRTLKVATALSCALLLAVAAVVLFVVGRAGLPSLALPVVFLSLFLTPAATWALAPRGFSIEGDAVRVLRNGWRPIVLPLRSIESAGPLPKEGFRGVRRLMGCAGMFGYYGLFWSRSLGRFRLYATRRQELVLIRAGGTTYLLAPDRPGRFLEVLRSAAGACPSPQSEGPR
jgi:hypothetical protein